MQSTVIIVIEVLDVFHSVVAVRTVVSHRAYKLTDLFAQNGQPRLYIGTVTSVTVRDGQNVINFSGNQEKISFNFVVNCRIPRHSSNAERGILQLLPILLSLY